MFGSKKWIVRPLLKGARRSSSVIRMIHFVLRLQPVEEHTPGVYVAVVALVPLFPVLQMKKELGKIFLLPPPTQLIELLLGPTIIKLGRTESVTLLPAISLCTH